MIPSLEIRAVARLGQKSPHATTAPSLFRARSLRLRAGSLATLFGLIPALAVGSIVGLAPLAVADSTCPDGWPRELAARVPIGTTAVRAFTSMTSAEGGPILVIGGSFTQAGGAAANRVAVLGPDGAIETLGSGFDADVNALAVLPSPRGPLLVAGGAFTSADGAPAARVAAWDGLAWSAPRSGLRR